jgi:hypothetical protein
MTGPCTAQSLSEFAGRDPEPRRRAAPHTAGVTTRHPRRLNHRPQHGYIHKRTIARREPASYTEIRIRGRLSPAVIASLGQLGTTVLPVETVVDGDMDDAALLALVDRIGELGLELIELRRFPDEQSPRTRRP